MGQRKSASDHVDEELEDFSHCFTGECRINVLPTLFKISQVIAESEDLEHSLDIILRVMHKRLKITRGAVTLYDRASETISIHRSFGLTDIEKSRGIYSPGEGITGEVVESGEAIMVPHIADDQRFLDRTRAHDGNGLNASFFCVPITHAKKVWGAISAERVYHNRNLLKQDMELVATLGSMIAPAVELYMLENVEKVRLENENRRLHNELKQKYKPENIIGNSKPMQDIYQLIEKVSSTKATVLVLGESGVGKELVASAIHYNSPTSEGPFVVFNCAALPESIVESELFGHEKGSFTGALAQRKGRFEMADGGTIFLDEVGELSLPLQAKLLRVLQQRTFERVGGSKPVRVDLRVIAATNRDLPDMIAKGLFREDLYYRFNVFPITIPPLRERASDVILLADHFVTQSAQAMGKDVKRISTPALNMLMAYHWPGNVRELENVIERAVILADDGVIHGYNLPPSLQTSAETGTSFGCGLEAKIQAVEYEMIVEALKDHNGNTTEAARELGLTRRILGLRMEKYNINYKTYRRGAAAGES
ncbi:sigma-54-dependent Fis family transcriptional regulator [Rhodoblastus sphagnicola]|uniref:Nitrogenase (Vanadium-iron)-specific transcriptional regulator n=1 Tax=Rhodoblastus sphagnicola TaxID=333368 RepID=A0A2P0ZWG5_9HYPH|nr:sigma 54-interacting transcriptional regulator [Rhodoblastus sphagnicola]AVI02151.1 nitrogenase (vanadium-iron)-specific transcriptional regulator [Rhodoblastus sphagnicola]MBB4198138.1 Nif-specific regulatory protein [Rhodoblastus sphagnicola]PPQ30900.1 sigma-54-dependent Fis family transcriptional regulator [Rhodoblastus sphagnicola]